MNISYEDDLGAAITSKQVDDLPYYKKIFTPVGSNLIKKIENYIDNELATIYYYKDAGELETDALNTLLTFNGAFAIIEREVYGSYIIENKTHYYAASFNVKTRELYDSNGLEIAYEEIDTVTNLPNYDLTNKYLGEYIDDTSTDYCRFDYNSDGSLSNCDYNYLSDFDREVFDATTLDWIKNLFMLTDSMYNYYLTADFMPPI
ncbi:MAG: hypothetical protein M3O71_23710 [Bacteroidota bacterium]|nr:hypothetical protein [Bacteroidota bacterium]